MAVNIWTVSIHDCDYRVPKFLRWFINGSAHHTEHHLKFNYNYGEYFTFWDRLFGTYKDPGAYHHDSPHEQLDNFLKSGKVNPCLDPDEELASANGKHTNGNGKHTNGTTTNGTTTNGTKKSN